MVDEIDHTLSLSCVRTFASSPKGGTFTLSTDQTFHLLFLLRQSLEQSDCFKCDKCPLAFRNHSSLKLHVSEKHPNGTSICYECNSSFSSFENLAYHTLAHHVRPSKAFSCNYVKDCGKTFSTRAESRLHFCHCHKQLPEERARAAKGPYATKCLRRKRQIQQDCMIRSVKRVKATTPVESNMLRRLAKLPRNALKKKNDSRKGDSRAKSK